MESEIFTINIRFLHQRFRATWEFATIVSAKIGRKSDKEISEHYYFLKIIERGADKCDLRENHLPFNRLYCQTIITKLDAKSREQFFRDYLCVYQPRAISSFPYYVASISNKDIFEKVVPHLDFTRKQLAEFIISSIDCTNGKTIIWFGKMKKNIIPQLLGYMDSIGVNEFKRMKYTTMHKLSRNFCRIFDRLQKLRST